MKVSELIVKLQMVPEDYEVIMAKDEEGNGYGEVVEVEEDEGNCVIIWPGYQGELDEVVDDYEYHDEDED